MNKIVKYSLFSAVFVGVIVLAVASYNYLTTNYKAEENNIQNQQTEEQLQIAPDFQVLNNDGKTVTLKEHFGKPIVINFWATWCAPCRTEMPEFNKIYGEYKDEVTFMMVNLTDGQRDTVAKVKDFIKKSGYTFPIYYDTEYYAAYAYGVNSVPMSIFINSNGEIVDYYLGTLSEQKLRMYIDKII
ncbi:MAG: TlpA disulfide reductase family protein [Eubacteriales bacterium]|nr:TlpA disulfide reductase family protein [Eubacteriales bacterium]